MAILGTLGSLALILLILIDAFETILQPRRITHRWRIARFYYRNGWRIWRRVGLAVPAGKVREAFLSVFGPVSLLGLFATWAFGLILGFGLLHMALDDQLHTPDQRTGFGTYLYLSGTTFFTLGLGDVTPVGAVGRALAVIQSGLGFCFLAVIVSYLPVLSQAFSRREVTISLLDARAGSPPTAGQCLIRLGRSGNLAAADGLLLEWERWAAEVLESHLSFPVLSYYRSQHDNQSWLAALTCVLDTCAILLVDVKSAHAHQAQLTFAMARHALVDLALVLKTRPSPPYPDRLTTDQRQRLKDALRQAGLTLHERSDADVKLAEFRGMYEPFLHALAYRFLLTLPPVISCEATVDNWQTSAWMPRIPGFESLPGGDDAHFD